MGNGEVKEFIHTTHGHELRWGAVGDAGGKGVQGGVKERKNGTTVVA